MTYIQDLDRPAIDITLRDGSVARLRPIRPGDQILLEEGFDQLSAESRRARFGAGIHHLSHRELDYLANVDLVEHVAWGALINDVPAAAGRYVKDPERGCAEIAITVADEYQRRGLGRILFLTLAASARHNGIQDICFSVQPSNEAVLRLLKRFELDYELADGLMVGKFKADDIPESEYDEILVALLAFYQTLG